MKKWHIALVFLMLIMILIAATFRFASVYETTRLGAVAALNHIEEWTKWMAGIQTAALTVLLYIVFGKETGQIRVLPVGVMFAVACAFVFLGAALLCNSWIFSSLSSHAIRIYSIAGADTILNTKFDVYENRAFGWFPYMNLGYLITAAHWLWVSGLLALGVSMTNLFRFRASERSVQTQ